MIRYPISLCSGRTTSVAFRKRTSLRVFFIAFSPRAEAGFVVPSVLFIDSIHIKTNANKRKYKKKLIRRAAQQYKDVLDQEVHEDRILHEKKPFTPKKKSVEEYQIKESTPLILVFARHVYSFCSVRRVVTIEKSFSVISGKK